MAKKKTIKDVEVEEVKAKKKELEEELEEEVEEVEEEIDELEEDLEDEIEEDEETDEDFEGDEDIEAPKKEEKKEKKKKEHKDKKESYFSKVRREMRKVVWPTIGEVVKYSIAVILLCVVLCLFFLGINAIASLVKGLFS
mgnify:CR=1 FL=1